MKKYSFLKSCFTKRVKVSNQALVSELLMDARAAVIMRSIEKKVSPMLFAHLCEMLYGFSWDMQRKIANNLLLFVCLKVAFTTGCLAVDTVLGICYVWMGAEQGLVKKRLTNKLVKSKAIEKDPDLQLKEVTIDINPASFDMTGMTKGRVKRKDYLMFVLAKRQEEDEAMERGELKEKDRKTVKELREMFGEDIYEN